MLTVAFGAIQRWTSKDSGCAQFRLVVERVSSSLLKCGGGIFLILDRILGNSHITTRQIVI